MDTKEGAQSSDLDTLINNYSEEHHKLILEIYAQSDKNMKVTEENLSNMGIEPSDMDRERAGTCIVDVEAMVKKDTSEDQPMQLIEFDDIQIDNTSQLQEVFDKAVDFQV